VADFVLRRLGREWLDYAINPLVAGIYAGDPHRLSVSTSVSRGCMRWNNVTGH
jgi:oxygen-dependent protoporphyrinogen oxidase